MTTVIRARDNPKVKRWTKLASDASFRRSEKCVLVEGPHLVAEALHAGVKLRAVLVSESGLQRADIQALARDLRPAILDDRVFRVLANAETPPGIAAEIDLPQMRAPSGGHSVFLEGVQDPSNVGAILRSAAAFGVGEAVLDRACADPWSPKALRAGMGAHFKLAVRQVAELGEALGGFTGTTVCAVPSGGEGLKQSRLAGRLGWIFGAEGRGVSEALARRAQVKVTITMAPGTESLNVAAAAAICFYETFSRPGGGCAARAGSS